MNTVDAFVLVVIAFNLLLGAIRGAVWQILRVASIVLGVWAAATHGRDLAAALPARLNLDGEYAPILAQVVVFLSVYLVMHGVTQAAKRIVDRIKLGSLDRLLGALIGAAKGAFFCSVALYLQFTPLSEFETVRGPLASSAANRVFLSFMKDHIDRLVPESVEARARDLRDRMADPKPSPR